MDWENSGGSNVNDGPEVYEEEVKLSNIQMQEYRINGTNPDWRSQQVRDTAKRWGMNLSPKIGQPLIFHSRRVPFEDEAYFISERAKLGDSAKERMGEVTQYFDQTSLYKFRRVLGAGGREQPNRTPWFSQGLTAWMFC